MKVTPCYHFCHLCGGGAKKQEHIILSAMLSTGSVSGCVLSGLKSQRRSALGKVLIGSPQGNKDQLFLLWGSDKAQQD